MDQPYPMASLLADNARIQILIGRPDWIHKALSPDNPKIALIQFCLSPPKTDIE